MKKTVCGVMLICFIICVCAGAASASIPMGTRSLGMGGAFTAIADDSSATYYNPAGLVQIHSLSFQLPQVQFGIDSNLSWRDLAKNPPTNSDDRIALLKKMHSGVSTVDLSLNTGLIGNGFAFFVQPTISASLDATKVEFGTEGNPTAGSKATIDAVGYASVGLSLARKTKGGSSFGATVRTIKSKDIIQEINYTGVSDDAISTTLLDEDKTGMAMDLGYLSDASKATRVGVMVRNFVQPSLGAIKPNREFNVGVAHTLANNKMTLAADIQSMFNKPHINLGMEYKIARPLTLWAGDYRNKPTIGAELNLLGLRVNASYSPENSSLVSGSVSF